MLKNQFTGTAMQPQRNREFCQFNKDRYCSSRSVFDWFEPFSLYIPPAAGLKMRTSFKWPIQRHLQSNNLFIIYHSDNLKQ